MRLDSFIEQQATFRKLPVHWYEGGNTEGPILFFLHGYPDGPEVWDFQTEYFAKRFHVLCPYAIGTHPSTEKTPNFSRHHLNSLCLDYLQLLERVDPDHRKRVYIVAHDLAGPVAWALAGYLKKRLAKMVIINSLSLGQLRSRAKSRPSQWLHSWYIYPMLIPYLPQKISMGFASPLLKFAYFMGGLHPSKRPPLLKKGPFISNPMIQYRSFAKQLLLRDFSSPPIQSPVMVVWGQRDPFVLPPSIDELEKEARHLTVRTLSGGHWIFRENPEQMNRLLEKFFET